MRHAFRSAPAAHRFHRSPLVLAAALACTGWAHAQSDQPVGTPDTPLPQVTVRAKVEAPVSQHLERPVAAGALGTRTALETPYSTTTITAEQIEQGTPRKLGDLFLNDASVSDNSGTNTAWASYLSVRGLQLDWQDSFRIDGKPFLSYAVTLPYEMFEQIDLLKGSSGFMYGFGAPGGMLNYVTKKPTDTPVRSVSVGYGSDSLWRTNVDLGGRVGEDKRFGYRLSATHEEGTTSNDGSLRRDSVLLSLDARLTSSLTWDFQSLYQDRRASSTEISIASYSLAGTALPRALRNDDATLVGPGNHTDNSFQFYSTGLKYQLNQDWQLSGSYSHSATRTRRNESVLTLLDADGNYTDTRSDYAEVYQFNNLEAMVQGHLRTGSLQHQIVAGVSWQKQKSDGSDYTSVDAGTGNLYAPNTNSYYSVGSFDSLNLTRSAEIEQKALYVSDTVAFNAQWSVLAGLRTTNYDQQGATADSHYGKSGVLTPSLAVMYRFVPGTMAYASYVESLEAGSIVAATYDNRGALLNPLKSKQVEVGLKTERQDWSATAALFRIEKKAEYARDNVLVQDGQSNYQGLELGAAARLGAGWSVGGNLMLLDTEYSKGADNIGNRVAGTPRAVVTAQLGYRVPQISGLQLNAGAKYTGNTMLRPDSTINLGGYTVTSVGATYDTTLAGYDTTWRLNVQNLGNKTYWMYQYDDYIKAGDPRTFNLSATLRF